VLVPCMIVFSNILIVVATVALTEVMSWAIHRYVMHGWAWRWHAGHHADDHEARHAGVQNGPQWNDLFALGPASISVALMWLDDWTYGPLFWVGTGMAVYGLLYLLVHEGLAHGRLPLTWRPRNRYLKRLVQAHRLHHAVRGRDGSVSFGFLYAPPIRHLRDELRRRRAVSTGD